MAIHSATNTKTTTRQQKLEIQFDLFHLLSPILMESQLVSFPALINMLKFSA
jgi:hypothetical protein